MGGDAEDSSVEQLLNEGRLMLVVREIPGLGLINRLFLLLRSSQGNAKRAVIAGYRTAGQHWFFRLFVLLLGDAVILKCELNFWCKSVLSVFGVDAHAVFLAGAYFEDAANVLLFLRLKILFFGKDHECFHVFSVLLLDGVDVLGVE